MKGAKKKLEDKEVYEQVPNTSRDLVKIIVKALEIMFSGQFVKRHT